ncbi:MAG TPA: aromatic acid decarboxylase, partial [Thauera sp.]|nr:aromatic acid decarboxylase [Thauera sp.]
DFVVARILDQLGVPHALMARWGEDRLQHHDGGADQG